jgi:hypothetical protein
MQPKLADDLSDFSPFVSNTSVDNDHWYLKIERNGPKMSFFTVSDFFSNKNGENGLFFFS